jgi:hypothetical protein
VTSERETPRAADEAAELAERLAPVLARRTGWDAPRVEGLARLSGGASRDTWSLDAVDGEGRRHPLILQRQRSLVVDAWLDTAVEARLLEAARKAGVPTAAVLSWSAGSEELGLPYLLFERIDGETIPQRRGSTSRIPSITSSRCSTGWASPRPLSRSGFVGCVPIAHPPATGWSSTGTSAAATASSRRNGVFGP